jgi:hypothetical protein
MIFFLLRCFFGGVVVGWVPLGGCVSLVVCVVGSVDSKIFLPLAPFRLQTSFPIITKQEREGRYMTNYIDQ